MFEPSESLDEEELLCHADDELVLLCRAHSLAVVGWRLHPASGLRRNLRGVAAQRREVSSRDALRRLRASPVWHNEPYSDDNLMSSLATPLAKDSGHALLPVRHAVGRGVGGDALRGQPE